MLRCSSGNYSRQIKAHLIRSRTKRLNGHKGTTRTMFTYELSYPAENSDQHFPKKRFVFHLTTKTPLLHGVSHTEPIDAARSFVLKQIESSPSAAGTNANGLFTKIFRQMAVANASTVLEDVIIVPADRTTEKCGESMPLMTALIRAVEQLPGYSEAGVDEQSCQQRAFTTISKSILRRDSSSASGSVFHVSPVARAFAQGLSFKPLPFARNFEQIDDAERSLLNKLIRYSTPGSENLFFAREALWTFSSTRLPGQLTHIVVDKRGPISFRLSKNATSLEFSWADGTSAQVPLVVPWIKPHQIMPASAKTIEANGVLYEPLLSEKIADEALINFYSLRYEAAARHQRWTASSYIERVSSTFSTAFQMQALKGRHSARWQRIGGGPTVAELALNPSLCEIFPSITAKDILTLELIVSRLSQLQANRIVTSDYPIQPEPAKHKSISALLSALQKQVTKEPVKKSVQEEPQSAVIPSADGLQMPKPGLLVDYNERLHRLQSLPVESQLSLSRVGEAAASVIIDVLALCIASPTLSTPDTSFKKAVDTLNHRKRPLTRLHHKISAEHLLLGDIVAIDKSFSVAFSFVQRHVLFTPEEKDWEYSSGSVALTDSFPDLALRLCERLRRSADQTNVDRFSRALAISFSEPELVAFRLGHSPFADEPLASIGRKVFDLIVFIYAATASRYPHGGVATAEQFASAVSSAVFGSKTPDNMNRIFCALTLVSITEDWSKFVASLLKVLDKIPPTGSQQPAVHTQPGQDVRKSDLTTPEPAQSEEQRTYDLVLTTLSKLQAELETIKADRG